jgi:fibronectin-binding autotransporter adhesin
MTINGLVDDGSAAAPGTGTVRLTSSGNIVESTGTLTAGTLTGSAIGSATLTGTNLVSTLGNFTAAGFNFVDGRALAVAGLVNGGTSATIDTGANALTIATGAEVRATSNILLNSGLMTINGLVDDGSAVAPGTGTVTLNSSGNVVESTGTLTAGTLTGSAIGSATLTGTNLVSTLGNFSASGFNFVDGRALAVAGLVNGGTSATIDTGANALTIATGGEVRATGNILLNSGLMTINGLVDDGSAVAPGTGTVTLNSSGNIVESTGTLTAGTLTGSAIGSATLTGTNLVSTLGNFTAAGLNFVDGRALAVAGLVNGGTSATIDTGANALTIATGGEVRATSKILLNSGLMTINGLVDDGSAVAPGTGTVTLNSSGNIVESTGTLTAGTLTGSAVGSATLTGTNLVSTLGNFTAAGFNFVDGRALAVTGLVNGGTSATIDTGANALTIATGGEVRATSNVLLNSGLMTINGLVDDGSAAAPGTGTVKLNSSGNIVESTGTLTAGTLTGSAIGSATLTGTNAISNLATFNDAGSAFTLNDATALTQTGTLTAATASITNSNASTQAIAINGAVNTALGTVLTASAGGIALAGNLGVGSLTLNAAKGVSQTSGTITTDLLQSGTGVTGNVTLNQSGNAIGTLSNFAVSSGNFSLTDAIAITQIGTLSANSGSIAITDNSNASAAITANGVISAGTNLALQAPNGGLVINGAVSGGTGVNFVASGAGITEASGATIATPQLTGSLTGTGAISLVGTGNNISGVGNLSAPGGTITLVDTVDPNVNGIVTANAITLTETGPSGITITGTLSGTNSVSLNTAGGGVRESSGRIITSNFSSGTGITGDATLTGANNQIGTLGSLAVNAGALRLNDAQSLTLSGPVSASNGATLNVVGNLTVAGSLSSPGQVVTLASTGALNQTGGAITAGVLNASGSTISLGQSNLVANLGTVASAGAIIFRDGQSFSAAGPIFGSSVTVLSSSGIVFGNNVTTSGVFDVSTTSGSVIQSGGTISALTLQSSSGIAGDLSLNSAGNRIANLGSMSTGGAFSLNDATGLNVIGPVSTGGAGRVSAGGPIVLAGNWTGPSLDLATSAGGVSQTSGILTVGTLSAANGINGPASFTSGGNRIASLGSTTVAGGNLTVVDNVDLAVTGSVVAPNISITTPGSLTLLGAINTGTLALSVGGTIVRPTGAGNLTVGLLTGNANTLANFGKSANVTQLGSFSVSTGTLSLDNAQPLTITGPLSADYIGITATGLLTISGTVNTVGLPASTQLASPTPLDPGTYFAVRADTTGNAAINQIGTLTIQSAGRSQTPTVRFFLPTTGGKITIDNTQGTSTNLVLSTGNGGTATGNVNIGGLIVSGTGGSASLAGTVRSSTGPEAARLAQIQPVPNTTYRLNACPIASVNCVLIPLGVLPSANPLRDFVLDTGRYNSDDDDVALPDISSRDY